MPAAPAVLAVPPAARPAPRRPRSQAGLLAAVLSVLVHIFFFAVVRFEFVFEPRAPRIPVRAYQIRPAMQAYNIEPVYVAPGAIEPVLPPPRELAEVALPAPPAALPSAGAPGAPDAPATLREQLGRTPTADLELWRPVTPGNYQRPLTEEEVLRARLSARLGAYNDSVSGEALARERATDWTVGDAEGGRWGVSPGKVHLGGITLPLPVNFSPPPGRRDEVAAKARSWGETQSQARRAEANDNFDDRVKAIRERRQAERDSARTPDR